MRSESIGQSLELLSERWAGVVGISALSRSHHLNHLDTGKRYCRTGECLETEHGPYAPFDPTMILLDAIIQVLALPDTDRLRMNMSPFLSPGVS